MDFDDAPEDAVFRAEFREWLRANHPGELPDDPDQAFEVLQSVLEVRGFSGQVELRGKTTVLKIVPLDRAVQSTRLLTTNGSLRTADLRNQVVTQVIPIENVDAGALSRELKDLVNKGASIVASAGTNALIITDTAGNVERLTQLVVELARDARALFLANRLEARGERTELLS